MKNELDQVSGNITALNKIEEVFRNITEGLGKNPSLDLSLLLLVAYSLIEEALDFMDLKEKTIPHESTKIDYVVKSNELRKNNKAKTFEIQEGAAQNKSICENSLSLCSSLFTYSQSSS